MSFSNLQSFAGWIPAIILPLSTIIQLTKILKEKSYAGVSALSWFLFSLANVGAYIFSEKYFSIQSILAFLLTAMLDLSIVFICLYSQRKSKLLTK